MDAISSEGSFREARTWLPRHRRLVLVAMAALLLLALAGRILTYPLQHDEQFYLPPGLLVGEFHLYRDLGFTHLPNLPLLMGLLSELAGPSSVLLVGRLVIVAAWIGLAVVIARAGRMFDARLLATATAAALLLCDLTLLGEAGMAATNNFVGFPLACGGLLLFIAATRHQGRAPLLALAGGLLLALAAGFKANIAPLVAPVGVAALLVPPDWRWRTRLLRLALPLLAGGVIGGLPTLLFLFDDPASFLAQVVAAHRGPQIAYWLANPDPADPKVIGWSAKLIFARGLWLSGTALLMLLVCSVLLLLVREQSGSLRAAARQAGWEAWLLLAIIATGVVLSFVPTPAFPQYYTLPLPFGALLLLQLHGRLDAQRRRQARPLIAAALVLAAIGGAPSLLSAPFGTVQPGAWASAKLADDGGRVAEVLDARGSSGPVAGLEPLAVLAASRPMLPELALGPFRYRAADFIPPAQRAYQRHLASPRTVGAILEQRRPAAVLVGRSPELDAPLAAFARANGYQPVELAWRSAGGPRTRTLFVAPPASRAR